MLPRLARFNQATTWVLKSITYDSDLSPLPFRIDAHLGYSDSEVCLLSFLLLDFSQCHSVAERGYPLGV